MTRVRIFTKPAQIARPISILMFLILLIFIGLDSLLPERITRYGLRLALFIFNSSFLISSNVGYESTLSIILNKSLLSFIKNRS